MSPANDNAGAGPTAEVMALAQAMRERGPFVRIEQARTRLESLDESLETLSPQKMAERAAAMRTAAMTGAMMEDDTPEGRLAIIRYAGQCAFEAEVYEAALRDRGLA